MKLTNRRPATPPLAAGQTTNHQSGFDSLPDTALVRESQIVRSPKNPESAIAPLPFSAPTLWRKVAAGTFPKPIKLSERVTAWRVSEVRAWMAAQEATNGRVMINTNNIEKAPGACDSAGLTADNNGLNFSTGTQHSKAIAALTAKLSIDGHAVHRLASGGFLVCKYGHSFHAQDFAVLEGFARRVGVTQ